MGGVKMSSEDKTSWMSHSNDSSSNGVEQERSGVNSSPPSQGPPAQSPPPNGGYRAWCQALCGFILFFNTFGILTSFGVFQTHYESSSSSFHRSSSDISWIGSIQAFLLQFVGLFAGVAYDKGYLRVLICFGSFLVVFGHMMLSIATAFWQVLLSQGFCVGLGMGCLHLPAVSILPSYFSTRLGLAVGVASSGSAVGGLIYPIVMKRLIQELSFPWAVRIVGFIALVTLAVPICLMRMRFKPTKARALVDWSAFSDPAFMWFAVATSIGQMGLNAFQIFFSFYAANTKITSMTFSFNLVSIFNASSALGRIIPNALSDKVGQWNILAPATLCCSAIYYSTIATHSEGPMIGISILGGFFLGVLTALPPVCFTILTKDKSKLGSRIGTGYAIVAFGLLAGGPGAGGILERTDPLDWRGLFIFAGSSLLTAGVMYTVMRFAKFGYRLNMKA